MIQKFSSHDKRLLLVAAVFQVAALLMMKLDPSPYGFGMLTLWIAPILLLFGLAFPFFMLLDQQALQHWKSSLCKHKVVGISISFLSALALYLNTLEPTASLWDCSETIAAAYKLQVPHTPGTPLTLLFGRFFSILALGNSEYAAWAINFMVALFSASAVSLTFLIIWHFSSSISSSNLVKLMGVLSGSLCLAFSDSFWFSAVEAETYGPSVFFMLLLLQLSITGSQLTEQAKYRRILLLSYLAGLSYCVHPMCILILPVCFLVWRFEKQKWNLKIGIIYFAIGIAVVLIISRVIAVHLFEWSFYLDLFLVNQLFLPLYSGVVLLGLLVGILLWVLSKKTRSLKLPVASFLFILAGFTPYLMLFTRASKQPPINEFSPDNLAKIKPYMNRESYPSRPLLYGPYYNAQIIEVNPTTRSYVLDDSRYKPVGRLSEYVYERGKQTVLPRIYSNDKNHIKIYQRYTGVSPNENPKFSDNVKFMIHYQLGHMYMRYLMWNFAGRVSDRQHAGWMKPWDDLPDRSASFYNKATNQYFMLPLLLGILGCIVQYKRNRSHFFVNLAFFAITGLLLAVYLNGTPNEPRERDYIYVGSFISFSIWIGLGAVALAELIANRKTKFLTGTLLVIPLWMLYQNYDDHDRGGRTFQMDYARSILGSCDKGAILFTGGDNDTFPLWYLQDVEGFRTDVRVKVLSYFNADWYINQLSRKYYDSDPFDLTLKKGENEYGPYNLVQVSNQLNSPIHWNKFMAALNAEHPAIRIKNSSGDSFFLPSDEVMLDSPKGPMRIRINGSYLPKNELAILDIIQSNEWKRPIYFNFTSLNSLKTDLRNYVTQEGMIYRLKAEKNQNEQISINKNRSYENLIAKVDYSNLQNPAIYFNYEDYLARTINPLRFSVNELIKEYLLDGEAEKAKELIAFAEQALYPAHLEPSYAHIQLSQLAAMLDLTGLSQKLLRSAYDFYLGRIEWQSDLGIQPSSNDLVVLQETVKTMKDEEATAAFNRLINRLDQR